MPSAAKKLNPLAITSRAGLTRAIKEIGMLRREIARLETEMNTKLTKITGSIKGQIERRHQKLTVLEKDAADFCLAYKDELLDGGQGKTANLATGQVQFKKGRPNVRVDKDEDSVIARLREAHLDAAVRLRASVDKNYVLSNPEIADRIKGLSIEEGKETVVFKPTSAT